MKTKIALLFVLAFGSEIAHADLEYQFAGGYATQEEGTSGVLAELAVIGRSTTFPFFAVGGGFTLTCESSTFNSSAHRVSPYDAWPFQQWLQVRVPGPNSGAGIYHIPDFESWPAEEGRDCTAQFTVVVSSSSGSLSGAGASITLGGGEARASDGMGFSAIRHWAEPCCDQPYQCEEH